MQGRELFLNSSVIVMSFDRFYSDLFSRRIFELRPPLLAASFIGNGRARHEVPIWTMLTGIHAYM